MRQVAALLLVAVLASGCLGGEPRVDISSAEALETSLEEIRASLPADQEKQFNLAFMRLVLGKVDMGRAMELGAKKPSLFEMVKDRQDLSGKTAPQIMAEADAAPK